MFLPTTIRAIAGLVILSVQMVRFAHMEEVVSAATIRGLGLGGGHVHSLTRVSSWTIGVQTCGRMEMEAGVGHVAILARWRPHRAIMGFVPNAPSTIMLSRTMPHLLVGLVSRILSEVELP